VNTQEATQAIEGVLFLSFVEGLSQRVGQRIDEDDYPKLAALASASAFVAGRGQRWLLIAGQSNCPRLSRRASHGSQPGPVRAERNGRDVADCVHRGHF